MRDLRIAPATADLAPQILNMSRETFETHRARHPAHFKEKVFRSLVRKVEAAFARDEGNDAPMILTAQSSDGFAGYVTLTFPQSAVFIYDIAVLPQARRGGVARSLLNHVESEARRRKAALIVASVWDGNDPSHALFKSAGYRPRRRWPVWMRRLAGVDEHTTLYRLDLARLPKS